LLPSRTAPRQVNEFGAALTRKYPGRFGHFASLPLPDVTGCLDELRYALDELGDTLLAARNIDPAVQ